MKDLNIDMWYGDKFEPKKYRADASFREQESWYFPEHSYVGNIYDDSGKMIGDYTAKDSTVVEANFIIEWRD